MSIQAAKNKLASIRNDLSACIGGVVLCIKGEIMERELTLKEILMWVVEHSEDTEAMNKINRLTYQFIRKTQVK